jgi:hypothetical protein
MLILGLHAHRPGLNLFWMTPPLLSSTIATLKALAPPQELHKSQTLYLSELIEVPHCKNPSYFELHIGLYMAAMRDCIDHVAQQSKTSAVLARLWLGLRGLRLSKTPGQAMGHGFGLVTAWPGLGRGFYSKCLTWCVPTIATSQEQHTRQLMWACVLAR